MGVSTLPEICAQDAAFVTPRQWSFSGTETVMSRAMIAVFSLVAVGGWFITLGVNADEPTTNLPPRTIPFGSRVMPGRAEISQTTESEVTTRLVGIARPSRLADLRSSVSGPIIEVAVRDNDRVKAGDVLVRLDDRIQQAAVKVAQVEALRVGSLSLAQIELRLAEQQLQRVTRAFERQAGSQFEVDEKHRSAIRHVRK